jgi:hypothetical protein
MSLTVSFSFKNEGEKKAFEEYAEQRGIKLSALAKVALFQYRKKNPLKKLRNGELTGLCEKEPEASNTPAAVVPTGSGKGSSD